MAWDIPPAANTPWRDWKFIAQFAAAVRERAIAGRYDTQSGTRWARGAWVYDSGTITAITATTLTDSGVTSRDPYNPGGWPTSPQRWAPGFTAGTDGTPIWVASSYEVVIDPPCPQDPRGVIRATISANTATTLTIADLTDQITARRALSLSALVGRKYYIIREAGAWWDRGWPEYPNSFTFLTGRIADGSTATTIIGAGASWTTNQWAGKDVMFNVGGTPKRGQIASNTADTLTFSGSTGVPETDGAFFIVTRDAFYEWGRTGTSLRYWYRGSQELWWTHLPDDTLGQYGKARTSVSLSLGSDPGSCPLASAVPIFDLDYWVDQDDMCSGLADTPLNPDIHRSIRGWWNVLLRVCGSFYDKDATPDGATAIVPFTEATWFKKFLPGNSATATSSGHDGTGLLISLSPPFTPIDLWYTVQDSLGRMLHNGKSTYDGTRIVGDFTDGTSDGKTVVVSWGPTRYVPRRFRSMFPKTILLPTVESTSAVWPPDETAPGTYSTTAASSHYLISGGTGFVAESSAPLDAIANGHYARYVGDNAMDPTTNDSDGTPGPLTPFLDHAFTGTRSAATLARIDASKSGAATSGGSAWLQDTSRDWWSVDFYDRGTIFERTGTATGGSTTTLQDTTQAGSAFWNDTLRNQAGLTLEVLMSGADFSDPNAVIEKRLVTAHSGTTLTVHAAYSASTSGKQYRIREIAAEINRWQGRTVTIVQGGNTATATVLGNDDDTLFFAPIGFAIDDTTSYTIDDPHCGGVWLRSGGAWTKLTPGAVDPRGGGTVKFRPNPNDDLEDHVARYGLPLPMDIVTLGTFKQVYDGINALAKTIEEATWTDTGAPANKQHAANGSSISMVTTWAEAFDNLSPAGPSAGGFSGLEHLWGTNVKTASGSDPPQAWSSGTEVTTNFDGSGAPIWSTRNPMTSIATRVYTFATADVPQGDCPIGRSVGFYVKAIIDPVDHDDGEVDVADVSPAQDGSELVANEYRFDANGDGPPVEFRKYKLWSTITPFTTDTTVVSGELGDVTLPYPDVPPEPGHAGQIVQASSYKGWIAGDALAIIDWSFKYKT